MYRERIRSIGISLLGGNSGSGGRYELGIDSIRIVNDEDMIRTPPGAYEVCCFPFILTSLPRETTSTYSTRVVAFDQW